MTKFNAKTFWSELGSRLGAATRRAPRTLFLRENLPLGDKRFVAVIECDGRRYLVGGAPQSVNLLAQLEDECSSL